MKKRVLAMLLAMMMLGSLASCASEDTAETKDASGETAAVGNEAETEPAWQFPDVDYGGAEYRILNFDQLWQNQ